MHVWLKNACFGEIVICVFFKTSLFSENSCGMRIRVWVKEQVWVRKYTLSEKCMFKWKDAKKKNENAYFNGKHLFQNWKLKLRAWGT